MQLPKFITCLLSCLLLQACDVINEPVDPTLITVKQGMLKGYILPHNDVVSFKGVPYAAAPINDRRWLPPHAAEPWKGVKVAGDFGHKCMQNPLFSDMQFRASGMSEDCLFLNVWTPAEREQQPLPVLVYFYGGGYVAGDGSENRYDGGSMAAKGIVTVTVNYRLGLFGFLAHPELSAQSQYAGSGNFGLLDQQAALIWVAQNIAAFGGDPKKITIAGESAGSISVSAQMLAADSIPHIAGAIAESGSIMGHVTTLAEAEEQGLQFAQSINLDGSATIETLRKIPADDLLKLATENGFVWFRPTIDGRILTAAPKTLVKNKKYADVPLLAGVNSQEGSYKQLLGEIEPTVDNFLQALQTLYPEDYIRVAELYPANSPEQVKQAAQALMSDRFISASTWNFIDSVSANGRAETFYYVYDHVRPAMKLGFNQDKDGQSSDLGAVHSAEIEYALGNLSLNNIYQWSELDYQVSDIMQSYFVNFIKTGKPDGENLIKWPTFSSQQLLILKQQPEVQQTAALRTRYQGMAAIK
ncbi:carboxylesterase family protein [Paraglaciecola sp.]|uniref:carboxylesterase/lipase family protein n=1 Tax=Paraglaciecola sp. TaxID=1920173 RepID=UPI0030F43F21